MVLGFRVSQLKWLAACVLSILMVLFMMGCPSNNKGVNNNNNSSQSSSGKPFVIGLVTWPGYGPLFIAKEKNMFDGLDVQFKVIDDTAPRHAAFKSGAIDMIAETVDSFASGAPNYGIGVKAVYKTDTSDGADGLVVKKGITSIHDLEHKTVALPRGMPSHFLMLNLLKMNGMTSKDINIVDMAPQNAGEAFSAGKVDAAVTWEPYLSQAAKAGNGTVLLNSHQIYGSIVDIMVVSDKVLNDRAADVQKVVNAHFNGLKYLKENPKESYDIIAKNLPPLAAADVEAMLGGMDLSDPADNKVFFGTDSKTLNFTTLFKQAGEDWVGEKLIDKACDAKDCFTTQLIDAYTGPSFAITRGIPVVTPPKANAKPVASLRMHLNFASGSSTLTFEHYKQLQPVGERLLGFPTAYISIEGYTDNVGSAASNIKLSQARADSVASYICGTFGISTDRIKSKGYGPAKPVADNSTDAGKAKNRRVEFVLTMGEEKAPPAQ